MDVEGLLFNNPLSPEQVQAAVDRMNLGADSLVLDVGCGRGEMLAVAIETHGCRGLGVDPKEMEIERARKRLAFAGDRVTLLESTIQDADLSGVVPDAAFCVGSTHAYGGPGMGYRSTLAALLTTVKPGGEILVGEGYWRREPPLEYLAATGIEREEFSSHRENIHTAEELGLEAIHAETSSEASWDLFEAQFWAAAEAQVKMNPGSAKLREQAEHWRNWKNAYIRWGRETLGFGLYLYRTPRG